jgi:hypothetical protein
MVRSCRRLRPVCGASKSSPCERARLFATTWSPRARPSLRGGPDVASATTAGTWAYPSRRSAPTTLTSASRIEAPHRHTSWRGEASEARQCRTRIWVCARACSGRLSAGGSPVRTGNGVGHAKRKDDRLAAGCFEHPARGHPTNSARRREGFAHFAERDRIRRRPAVPLPSGSHGEQDIDSQSRAGCLELGAAFVKSWRR